MDKTAITIHEVKEEAMQGKNEIGLRSYLDWSDQGKSSFWRYAIGFVISVVIFFVLAGVGVLPLGLIEPHYQESLPLSILGILLAFVIPFFAIPILVKFLHQRPSWSVAMPHLRFEKWNFITGFCVAVVIGMVVALIVSLIGAVPIESNPGFNLVNYLPIAFLGFAGIFIQASSEEILFRGYFTQFARRFTSNKFIFIGIPTLLFALPHIANISKFGNSIFALAPYIIAGILYAWAAYRTGSLWMAVGLHLSNNYTGLVLIGTKGDVLPSVAPFQIEVPSLAVVTLMVAVQALAIYLLLSYLIHRREAKA